MFINNCLIRIHYSLLICESEIYGTRYQFCKILRNNAAKNLPSLSKSFPSIMPGMFDRLIVINLQLLYRSRYLKFKQSTKRLQNSTNFTTFPTIPNRPLQSLRYCKLIAPLRAYLNRSRTKYSLAYIVRKRKTEKEKKYAYIEYLINFIFIQKLLHFRTLLTLSPFHSSMTFYEFIINFPVTIIGNISYFN